MENSDVFVQEIKSLKKQLNDTVAEKIALDQSYCEEIRTKVTLKKEAVLLNQEIQKLCGEISGLKSEKDSLINQVKDLQSSLEILKPKEDVKLNELEA